MQAIGEWGVTWSSTDPRPEELDTATLYRVYLGRADLGGALRARKLTLSGPKVLQRAFGRWFAWSAFAPPAAKATSAGG